jgi:hypothetical protein
LPFDEFSMRKLFNKILFCLWVGVLVGTTLLMLSPLATVIAFENGLASSSFEEGTFVITASAAMNFVSGLQPRLSHAEFAFCLQKIIATHAVVVNACALGADEIRLFAEWQHYALANDLHFNIPLLTHRLPSSEHPSEG